MKLLLPIDFNHGFEQALETKNPLVVNAVFNACNDEQKKSVQTLLSDFRDETDFYFRSCKYSNLCCSQKK